MYAETPFVASLIRELHQLRLIPVESDDQYPQINPESEVVHAVFYLLQEVGRLPIRFRFKGSAAPYSADLANVLADYNGDIVFWAEEADQVSLSDRSLKALERLTEKVSTAPPDVTDPRGQPLDPMRWRFVLATFLFVASSPLYMNGRHARRRDDFNEYLPGAFTESELAEAERIVAPLLQIG